MKRTLTLTAILSLLGAAISHQTVQAAAYPVTINSFTPSVIISVEANNVERLSTSADTLKPLLTLPTTAAPNVVDWKLDANGVVSDQPDIELHHTAIIKDGDGELIIDQDLDMSQSFVVREGQTSITDATVTNTANSHSSASLTVAGHNASLLMDGATYTELPYAPDSHTRGIVVGGADGDGSLKLTNGSTLTTGADSFLIIGHSSWPSTSFMLGQSQSDLILNCGTYRDNTSTEDANRYRDQGNFADPYVATNAGEDRGMYNSTGHLTVENGSQISFGRIWALNSTITVSGSGSLMTDILSPTAQNNFGDGFMNDSGGSLPETTITVQDGGRIELNNTVAMSSWSGKTILNVQGEGSSFIANGNTIVMYNKSANGYSDLRGSKQVEINVTDGAHAHFSYLSMGITANNGPDSHTSVTIDETSRFTGGVISATGSSVTFTNKGLSEISSSPVSTEADPHPVPFVQFVSGATFINEEGATLTLNDNSPAGEGYLAFYYNSKLYNYGHIASGGVLYNVGSIVTGTGSIEAPLVAIMGMYGYTGYLYAGDDSTGTGSMEIQGDLLLQTDLLTDKVIVHSYGEGGSLNVHGGITADGIGPMEIQGDLTLLQDEAGLCVTEGSTLTITGHLDSPSLVDNDGKLIVNEGITLEGGAVACGTGAYDADVTSKSGAIILGGDLTHGTGITYYNQSLTVEAGSSIITSAGNGICVAQGFTVDGFVRNDGEISAIQAMTVNEGGLLSGTGTYRGTVILEAGAQIIGGDLDTVTGTTRFADRLVMAQGSLLLTESSTSVSVAGDFQVAGTIANEGLVSATGTTGMQVGNQGVLTGNGTYRGDITLGNGSTLIQGSPNTGFSQMIIDGNLSIREGAFFKSYIPLSPIITGTADVIDDGKTVVIDMTESPLVPGRIYAFNYGVEEDELHLLLPQGITKEVYDTPNPDVFRIIPSIDDATPTVRAGLMYCTPNGLAGAGLMEAIFQNWDPYNTAPLSDTAMALLSMDQLIVAGQGVARDRLQAALAGSATAVLGLAFSDDMHRQLRQIRDRSMSNRSTAATTPLRIDAWVQAEGNFRDLESYRTDSGYKLDSWGYTVGSGITLSEKLNAGLALTAMYGNLDARACDIGSGDLDTYYISAFATYNVKAWSHYLGIVGGWADAEMKRTVTHANGSYSTRGTTHGGGIGLMYELGYTLTSPNNKANTITPIINIAYAHTQIDDYSESGSDMALRFGDQIMNTLSLGTGVRATADIGTRLVNRPVFLEGRALLKIDVGNRRNYASFTTVRPLPYGGQVRSAAAGACGVELGIGITAPVGPLGGAVFVNGSLELREDYSNWNVTAGYRISF